MSAVSPINAHHLRGHGPSPAAKGLLRRPRPPKTKLPAPATSSKATTSLSSERESTSRAQAPSRAQRPTNTASYPHPTPLTPYSLYASTAPSRSHCDGRPETSDSRSTVTIHSLYPRGPPPLPPGKILTATLPPLSAFYDEHPETMTSELPREEGEFTLNDFQASSGAGHRVEASRLQGAMVSRQNYLKLTSWFATHVPKQEVLNTVSITGIPLKITSIPWNIISILPTYY